ncbi:hypothetical protein AWV80_06915 [Cupriavidus sp. UYMU48A]|nr:hypothetical protein AWV80_06915 [Cupriavidus sp. UYMU48A]
MTRIRLRGRTYTFHKPSRANIAQVKAGDLVRLIFERDEPEDGEPSAERMWVEIDEVLGDLRFRGRSA